MAKDRQNTRELEYVWCLCYINKDYVGDIAADLSKKPSYRNIEVYIPTVKLLKKKFKGKESFEDIPALFNYGFFKLPRALALYPEKLRRLKADVGAIYAWITDPAAVWETSPILSADNKETRNSNKYEYAVATIREQEIARLVKATSEYSIYSEAEIENLTPGTIITLHGFPFDNIPAIVDYVDSERKEVKVRLELFTILKEVTVSFENIFYTIYKCREKNLSDEDKIISLELLQQQYKSAKTDSLLFKANYYNLQPEDESN